MIIKIIQKYEYIDYYFDYNDVILCFDYDYQSHIISLYKYRSIFWIKKSAHIFNKQIYYICDRNKYATSRGKISL